MKKFGKNYKNILGILFFIRIFSQQDKKKYFILFVSTVITSIFYYYLIKFGKNYFQ